MKTLTVYFTNSHRDEDVYEDIEMGTHWEVGPGGNLTILEPSGDAHVYAAGIWTEAVVTMS